MVGPMANDDHSAITVSQAKTLFADWTSAPAIVLAVSGGPDSIALMWLAARWRRALRRGPRLIAVTVDHGLRREAAREARDVKHLAKTLDLPHRTLRWSDAKPKTGVPAAARAARYRLLAEAARASGATHILTAHTRDDQAETLLMRMLRGSGITGLAAMARQSRARRRVAGAAAIGCPEIAADRDAEQGQNRLRRRSDQPRYQLHAAPVARADACSRRRGRRCQESGAAGGRLARANAALEVLVDGAERYLTLRDRGDAARFGFDAAGFAGLAEEIRLRLLMRAIDRVGHEGTAELGKAEALLAALDRAIAMGQERLKQEG